MDILKNRCYIGRDLDVLPDQKDIGSRSKRAGKLISNFLRSRKKHLERALLTGHPACAILMEGTELETMRAGMWGEHIERTNIVCVSQSTPDILATLIHEQIHYLASLLLSTTPGSCYYRCTGMPSDLVFIPWFNEGTTGLLTEAVLKHNGIPKQRDSYLRELAALDYLVTLVGNSDLLIEAYLSSDVTELVARLTRILGADTAVKLFGDPNDLSHTRFPRIAQVSEALNL